VCAHPILIFNKIEQNEIRLYINKLELRDDNPINISDIQSIGKKRSDR
jgi:hypothetical protein